jgi:RND family efflux transporter MFP subunit
MTHAGTGRALLLIAALACLDACRPAPVPARPARPVRVEAVRLESAQDGLRYSATIQPYEQIARAFRVGGYVLELQQRRGPDGRLRDVQQGDEVARGALLARLDDADYRQRVALARAQLAEAEAALVKARADAARAQTLYASQSLTRPEYDAATAALSVAVARSAGAGAQLEAAELALRDCTLVAPTDGVVLARQVQAGSLAAPGTVAFVLADLTRVKAIFGVPDGVVQRLAMGRTLPVTSDAFGARQFPGEVTAVSPAADSQSRVFSVEITIPNPHRQLKAGMIASVDVPLATAQELPVGQPTVSFAAVVKSPHPGGGYAVFVVSGPDERALARVQDVQLGPISGNRVTVTQGLSAGQRVVVTGASLLTEGDPVVVIPGDGSAQ